MSKEANGKLKKLASALKPLKMPLLIVTLIWALSGVCAVFMVGFWGLLTGFLGVFACLIAMIVDYQAEREKKGAS